MRSGPLQGREILHELKIRIQQFPELKDIKMPEIQFLRSEGSVTRISGWNLRADIPRPRLTAAQAGTTYYFRPINPVDTRLLLLLEITGLGAFPQMGFGRFVVITPKSLKITEN